MSSHTWIRGFLQDVYGVTPDDMQWIETTKSSDGGELNTGFADHCNNDHGFSPDSKMLAISHRHKGDSLIYIMPSSGGSPRQITDLGPSYWHGWSPDSKYIAFVSYRLVGKDGEN